MWYIFIVLAVLFVAAVTIYDKWSWSGNRKTYTEEECTELIGFVLKSYKRFRGANSYVAQHEIRKWEEESAKYLPLKPKSIAYAAKKYGVEEQGLKEALAFFTDFASNIETANSFFVTSTKSNKASFFSQLQTHELTENQKEAVIVDETNTLVVAGAGTGKTATAVSKVQYLLDSQIVKPNEILILAYNTSAAGEFEEKLAAKAVPVNSRKQYSSSSQHGVTARTFHSLGKQIIGEASGRSPSLSPLAEDDNRLSLFIDEFLVETLLDRRSSQDLVSFLTDDLEESEALDDAQTEDEFIRATKQLGTRSIDGTLLKSREELCISNYLTLNGIEWEYEKKYPFNTATSTKQQYQPDFYLTDYDIYLEHFGIDENGRTRPGIDSAEYNEGIRWKRDLHQQYGTTLIETTSAMRLTGDGITANLDRLFAEHGVTKRNISRAEVEQLKQQQNSVFSDTVKLFSAFLNLFKTNNFNASDNKPKPSNKRDKVFLKLFYGLYEKYENELKLNGDIDFHDQINLAADYSRTGKYTSPYKYIIVDEFQDASLSRLELVKALRSQHWDSRVFVVGDDWQSIYRFAGSDINVMTQFNEYMGGCREIHLDTTFRFNQELAEVSSHFVQQNPSQIKKTITSIRQANGKVVSVFGVEKEQYPVMGSELWKAFKDIIHEIESVAKPGDEIKVLGRYKFQKPIWLDTITNLPIHFQTVHRSKGGEAEYVIVLGMENRKMGFPSQIADDSSLSMVLAKPDTYEHSEERRLFYVALTRAKHKVFLIHDPFNTSDFIQELSGDIGYHDYLSFDGIVTSSIAECPSCQGKTVTKKSGPHGDFWACNNYPLCNGKLTTCLRCKSSPIALVDGNWKCTGCGQTYKHCPSPTCNGYMIRKTGRYGDFLGCINYPECNSTQNFF